MEMSVSSLESLEMYQPGKYKKEDPDYILKFIQQHPFATFVIKGEELLATHIPVLAEGKAEDFTLYSHIANHNEQLNFLKEGTEALLIFQGAHAYISSSWYSKKDISTWDYSAVHVNVKISLQTKAELEASLEKLVSNFEKDQKNPLFYKDIPNKMLEEHLPLITGFSCKPFKIQGIAKLHQKYEKEEVQRVIKNLEDQDSSSANQLIEDIKKEHGADH